MSLQDTFYRWEKLRVRKLKRLVNRSTGAQVCRPDLVLRPRYHNILYKTDCVEHVPGSPGGSVVKDQPANTGDTRDGSPVPGSGDPLE